MRKAYLAALLGIGLVSLASPAWACSCSPAQRVNLAKFVAQTAVIFWGRPVSERVVGRKRVYEFVAAAPKGSMPVRVTVRTAASGATCGVRFQLNRTVLVGAGQSGKALYANSCTQYIIEARRAEIERILRRCRPFTDCR